MASGLAAASAVKTAAIVAFAVAALSLLAAPTPGTPRFRLTFATLAIAKAVPLVLLGDQLTTVEKNYLHYSPEYLRNAINRLSARPMSALPTPPANEEISSDSALYLRFIPR